MPRIHLQLAQMYSSIAGPFRTEKACSRMHMPHKKPEQTALRRRALAVEIVNRKRFQRDFIAQLITFARINFEYFTSSI